MKNHTRMLIAFALLTVMLTVCGCGKLFDPNQKVLEYTLVEEDAAALEELEVYVNLQTLDLRGSDCYDAIESYIASHPQVQVTYDVEVAGTRYTPDVEHLTLKDGSFETEELLSDLKHLPKLASLELPMTTLTADQMQSITDAFPKLTVTYTLELFGKEVGPDLEEVDLSNFTPGEVDENLLEKLRLLSGLTRVRLMNAEGTSNFAPADVKRLMDYLPGVAMDYSFELFGQTVTTADERVEFKEVEIGNEGIPEIRAALDILPNCTYFLMDDCGVDNEVMAQLRDDYPNTKVVWRVFWSSKHHALTDVEMINANSVKTEPVQVLKYCTEVKYLDLGHSSRLTDIDFVRYMPKLQICIIVDSNVVDLSPLANCPDLEWLEIVYCRKIKDISVLANCKKLKGVNMSMAYGIEDISPLYGLKDMERLYLGSTSITKEMYEEACEAMPNCWVTRTWYDCSGVYRNYAVGWRLDRDGRFSQIYLKFREIFRYTEYYYSGKGE